MGVFGEIGNFRKFIMTGAAEDGISGLARGAARGVKLGGGSAMDNAFVKNLYKASGGNATQTALDGFTGLSKARRMGNKTIGTGIMGMIYGGSKIKDAFRK